MNYLIRDYMTELPHSVGEDATPEKAQSLMEEFRCHHLPPLEGGHLVGLVSERDLQVGMSVTKSETLIFLWSNEKPPSLKWLMKC